MPDYNLGRAHGTVEIDYDGKPLAKAKRDVDDIGDRSKTSSAKVTTANADMQESYNALATAIGRLTTEAERHAASEVIARAKVAAAEKSLQEVRAKSESTAKQIKDAERDVSDAQAHSVEVTKKLTSSQESLRSSREKLNGIPLKPPDVQSSINALESLRAHVANIDSQTRKSASGLNTFTGRTKFLAGAIAVAIPGVAGLGVSLAALSGLAGVAAGALAAVGAAAATLAVGTAGVSDVFKAAAADSKAAGGAAASSASAQRAAARAIEDAQRSLADAYENLTQVRENAARAAIQAERGVLSAQRDLVNAQRDAVRAQANLTKARAEATRQLEDMRLALVGGAIDEKQATLDVAKAQQELNKILADPTATADDRAQAILNLEKEKLALEQAQLANQRLGTDAAAAAAKGVEGSDAVVSAQDSVRDSTQAVADAQQGLADAQDAVRQQQVDSARAIRDAVRGIEDAQRSLADAYASAADTAAGAASKTEDALKNISPNARAVVKEILGLKDEWQKLKFSVQDRLFAGLADDIKPLANIYFPLLEEGMGGIADGLNGIVQDLVAFLKTGEATDNVRQIFANTGLAVKNLRGFFTDLFAAFLDLAAVGSDFLPDMATGASNAAESFRQFVHNARETGKLKEWMQGGIDAVSTLWQLLKNLASIIGTVFSAFDQEGGGALNTLTALTGQIDKFLKSAEGQEALHALGRILASIGGAYGKVFMSFLATAADLLVSLEPLITAFADAAGVYLASALQILGDILKPIADLFGFLGPALGPVIAGIYAANKAVAAAKIVWLGLNAVMDANPFVLIAAAVIALAYLIYTNWDSIVAFLSGVWDWITSTAASVWGGIVDFFTGIGDEIVADFTATWNEITGFLGRAWSIITNAISSAWNGILDFFGNFGDEVINDFSETFSQVLNFFKELPGKIWNFIKSLPEKFVNLGKDIVSGILRGLGGLASALWTKLKNAVSNAWDSVLDFFGISSPSKLAMYAGQMVGKGLAEGIDGSAGMVTKAAQNMADAAALAVPGFDPNSPSGLAFRAGTGASQPVGLTLPTSSASGAAARTGNVTITVGTVQQNVTGNLDPTKPVAWRQAMVSLKDGIRQVDRDYA